MKKLLLLLLFPIISIAQVSNGTEQEFDTGIKNNAAQTVTTPDYIVTQGTDGTYGKKVYVAGGSGTVTSVTGVVPEITVANGTTTPVIGIGTVPQSKVAGLVSDLAGKVNTTGNESITGIKTFNNAQLTSNPIGTMPYYFGQILNTDYWKMYGKYDISEKSEMVFEVGDNGFNYVDGGERWRFHSNADGGGVAKDPLIIEYNDIYANANLTATTFKKSGGTSAQYLMADGSVSSGGGGDMVLATAQTVTGEKTFLDTKFSLRNVANTFSSYFTNTNTASRTYTLPDFSAGFVMDSGNQTIAGTKTFSANTIVVNGLTFGRGGGGFNTTLRAGYLSGNSNTGGNNWVAIGSNAGNTNVNQSDWTALGFSAGYSSSSGTEWTATGSKAGYSNSTGSSWVANGVYAGYSNSAGSEWTSLGFQSAFLNTTGSGWTNVGSYAGSYLPNGSTSATSFSNSVYVGSKTKVSANGVTNENVFGYNAIGSGSNTMTLGSSAVVKTVLQGVIQQTTYTVATLPAGTIGQFAFVIDALTPTYLVAVTGGGAVACPVFYNGTTWVSH